MEGLDEEQGRRLTAALRYDTHLAILKVTTPGSKLTASQKSELAAIIADAKRLKDCRDTLAHSAWTPGDDLLNPVTYRLRLKDISSGQPYSPDKIEYGCHTFAI